MTGQIEHSGKHSGWPPDQFHPVYDSFREWLDNEAPIESPGETSREIKWRNRRQYRERPPRPQTVVE